MQIELHIDGEKKIFTAPFVPMLAKRKYLEMLARDQKRIENEERITTDQQIEEEDELNGILVDVIFKNQFTLDQLYNGASQEYIHTKIREGIFGEKPKEDDDPGNDQGE